MEASRFDSVVRSVASSASRRQTLGAAFGGLLVALRWHDADAKRVSVSARRELTSAAANVYQTVQVAPVRR